MFGRCVMSSASSDAWLIEALARARRWSKGVMAGVSGTRGTAAGLELAPRSQDRRVKRFETRQGRIHGGRRLEDRLPRCRLWIDGAAARGNQRHLLGASSFAPMAAVRAAGWPPRVRMPGETALGCACVAFGLGCVASGLGQRFRPRPGGCPLA
jgi:hypothetical protein